MLDFRQIQPHFQLLAGVTAQRSQTKREQLVKALELVTLRDDDWQPHLENIRTQKTEWLAANPVGDQSIGNASVDAPPCPVPYSALACDGSQIPLDRHEVATCYLLNIGRIALHYGTGERPLMDSVAQIFYTDEEILQKSDSDDPNAESGFVTEQHIADRRFSMEIESLVNLAETSIGRPDVVGLVDGTLILWSKDSGPGNRAALKQKVDAYLVSMDRANGLNIPIAGYLSRPASREVIGALRICLNNENSLPLDRLTDSDLFASVLTSGQRSMLFQCSSRVLRQYGEDQSIVFFYLHTGDEIARIEIPNWVARNPVLVERVHANTIDQVRKGRGYPVCLAEAHEQAIVRAPERDAFFRLVQQSLLQLKIPALRTAKSVAKRRRTI